MKVNLPMMFWIFLHNFVAHPILGAWTIATFCESPPPDWLCRFHDYVANKCWEV
jgi:hypothetical protein